MSQHTGTFTAACRPSGSSVKMVLTGSTLQMLRILLVVSSVYLTATTSAANGIGPGLREAVGSTVLSAGIALPYSRAEYPPNSDFKRPSPSFPPLAGLATPYRDSNGTGSVARPGSRTKQLWTFWDDALQNESGNPVFRKGATISKYKANAFLNSIERHTALTHVHSAETTGATRQCSHFGQSVCSRPSDVTKVGNDRSTRDDDTSKKYSHRKNKGSRGLSDFKRIRCVSDLRGAKHGSGRRRKKYDPEDSHLSPARKAVVLLDLMNLPSERPEADGPAKASGDYKNPGASRMPPNFVTKRQDEVLDIDYETRQGQGKINSAKMDAGEYVDMAEMYDTAEFQEFRTHAKKRLAIPIRADLVKFGPVSFVTAGTQGNNNPRQHAVKRRGGYDAQPLDVCPSISDWIARRKAKDPYGHTLEVLEMIPYNGTLVRQYFYETSCVHQSQSPNTANVSKGSGEGAVTPSECLAVDKQAWNSRCVEKYIWTYAKVVKQNGDIGWSVVGIRGSCSCSVWPKTHPAGRRAGPRLFIDDPADIRQGDADFGSRKRSLHDVIVCPSVSKRYLLVQFLLLGQPVGPLQKE